MKESNIQTLFGIHIDEIIKRLGCNQCVFELKICKGNRFPFRGVKVHQVDGLIRASKGLYHKISDSPIYAGMKSRFTSKKPFDCLYIGGATGYVVICWYKIRERKELHFIEINDFIKERDTSVNVSFVDSNRSKNVSLSYDRSLHISKLRYNLNKK